MFDSADSMSVWNLLREFRIRKVHMAIVLNEYGGTVGVCVQFQVHFYSDSAPFCALLVHDVVFSILKLCWDAFQCFSLLCNG